MSNDFAVNDDNSTATAARLQDLDTRLSHVEHSTEKPRRWFTDVTTYISFFALVVSFGTTIVSYKHTEKEDLHALQTELRSILLRMNDLPRYAREASIKYPGREANQFIEFLNSVNTRETVFLAQQAEQIASELPNELVSPAELNTISQALEETYDADAARKTALRALSTATTLEDDVAALRRLAVLSMRSGDVSAARQYYERALNAFWLFPGYPEDMQRTLHVSTRIGWAYSESDAGNPDEAREQVDLSEGLANKIKDEFHRNQAMIQVNQARNDLKFGTRTGNAPGSEPLDELVPRDSVSKP